MNRSARADRQEVDDWLAKQRICITGGRGALGGHLARRLIPTGAEIVNFDNQSVTSLPDRSEVSSVRHVEGSILHQADLDDALGECQLVFHLAALIHAGDSRANPMRYFETNALGTACVAEACRRLDVGRMIYTSTSHVYGTPRQLPIAEDHPTRPLSVYAASKLAGEAIAQGYAASYPIACDIARLSNLYGASLSDETVVGRVLRQAVSGGSIVLRNLDVVRDFVHVDDVVEALVRLAFVDRDLSGCRIVNVSTGQGASVREMARTARRITGGLDSEFPIVESGEENEEHKEGISEVIVDNRLLRALTGWTPQISLEHGLRKAVNVLQDEGQRLSS